MKASAAKRTLKNSRYIVFAIRLMFEIELLIKSTTKLNRNCSLINYSMYSHSRILVSLNPKNMQYEQMRNRVCKSVRAYRLTDRKLINPVAIKI